ncbi:hypothetical protein CKAN_00488200 [Cinnamomum micranthum f. kanehirae]|uniref:Uncharacterized protein n=1 Tax=Cinnamomum micranthum f. kanehirae TaxID=337451 RepID=A0A443ND29_9MAGN|nr:hypothetical protein CKAN_00488200 [Cinnamomum micranthum f. kanehirae]
MLEIMCRKRDIHASENSDTEIYPDWIYTHLANQGDPRVGEFSEAAEFIVNSTKSGGLVFDKQGCEDV